MEFHRDSADGDELTCAAVLGEIAAVDDQRGLKLLQICQ